MKKILTSFLCSCIRLYQRLFSPLFPPCCRFYPSCSCYAFEAITKHGPAKGMWLSTKRILKCNRFFKGGYDPVP